MQARTRAWDQESAFLIWDTGHVGTLEVHIVIPTISPLGIIFDFGFYIKPKRILVFFIQVPRGV